MIPTANIHYAGGGLLDLGLTLGGLNVQQSFEIDSVACRVNRANSESEVIQTDLRLKLVEQEKPCDVMAATYPCNRYSTIGDIHGVRTGDELFLHTFRHIAIKQPEIYVVENVPGMRKFPVVMEAMTKLPDYYVNVFCPVQTTTWLPQRRDRLIIIGSKKRFNWRPPQSRKRVKLAQILERNPLVQLPKTIYNRLRGKYRDLPIIVDPKRDDVAPTCVAHYAKDLSTRLVADKRFPKGVRPFSVREYARLQGVPDSFVWNCSNTQAYKMIGNGVSIPVGIWLGKEITRYFN
ncbi:MAG TPA: DNA cytosine methyltransferase [Verrucomicrobiae bacterium]|nr:DNA cytosine methyltransferase [Verrucomicrobiae bacterium]